jgi:Flp pilus assembly protein TadG
VSRRGNEGQVLVLFAGAIVAFCALAALAVDVAMVYSLEQTERAAADAAALAGAQDLQVAGTRTVGDSDRLRAVQDAVANLVSWSGATGTATTTAPGSNCTPVAGPAVSVTDCALVGTAYWFTVKTPSPSFVNVNPSRAVQVSVRQHDVPLTFARILGQHDWNVAQTSVAGLNYGNQYAVVTLRGRKMNGPNDGQANDIQVNGGTVLNVFQGDIGTNTNVVMAGCGSGGGTAVNLDPNYVVAHFDPTDTSSWCDPVPQDAQLNAPMADPLDTVPVAPSPVPASINYSDDTTATDPSGCAAQIATAIASGYTPANWPTILAKMPTGLDSTNSICYKPGVYTYEPKNLNNNQGFLFEPGVYWFQKGLEIHGVLIGGYQAASKGVAFVFTEGSQCSPNPTKCIVTLNASTLFAVNEGSCVASSPFNCPSIALPARDWDGTGFNGAAVQVLMPRPDGTTIPVPESVIVSRDPACYVAVLEPLGCPDNQNGILNLPGGGNLFVAGVQYAPSDNVTISGNSGTTGRIGQLVVWTLLYTGNSEINEFFPGGPGNGVLRLDTACSASTSCTP